MPEFERMRSSDLDSKQEIKDNRKSIGSSGRRKYRKLPSVEEVKSSSEPLSKKPSVTVETIENSPWEVDNDNLLIASKYYFMDRNISFPVVGTSSASEVAKNIEKGLAKYSIKADYHGNVSTKRISDSPHKKTRLNAPPTADCITMDMVEFQIQLFLVRSESDKAKDKDLQCFVEVRRMSGCPIRFVKYKQIVKNCISDNINVDPIDDTSSIVPPVYYEEGNSMLPVGEDPLEGTASDSVHEALDRAIFLMENTKAGKYFGVKYLSFLSDGDLSNDIARVILCGTKQYSTKIREVIENLLRDVNSSLNDTCQAKNSSIHGVEDGADTELVVDSDLLHMSYYRESRHNAFLFLSNIIDRFDINADLDDNVDRIMIPWLLHKVMPLLIQELNDANKRPHEAFLASKCIRSLLKNFPEIIAMSNHASILRALQRAIKVGHMNHAHLERHCGIVMSLISA